MFKGIFKKLLLTYAAIIMLVVAMLAGLLTYFFNAFLFEQKQNQLLAAGLRAEELALDFYDGKIGRNEYARAVNNLGYITDSRVYLRIDEKLAELRLPEGREQDGPGESQVVADVKQILEGKTLIRKKQFSNQLNTYVVSVGMPIKVRGDIKGVVFLLSPLDQINKTLFKVYKIIWGAAAVSLVLAAAIIFIMSRRISKPIEKIQKAAAAIAEGNYSEDLIPEGRDEIAQLTGTFNYMKNRLKQIEDMRKDLIANVSHELRTPLTSIRGFIQGILDGVIAPRDQEKYLKRAYDETGRLNRLVNDLLQLARLQAGSIRLNRENVDAGELIREIVEENRLLAEQKNIALDVEAACDRLDVFADRDRLKQIILNLLHNALNYAGSGGKVRITAKNLNGKLAVSIEDNGPGIPGDQLDLIFQKFHRVEKAGSQNVPGTGLGLSIARELVELHGGSIYARSEINRSTEIGFELPKREPGARSQESELKDISIRLR
jgi:signal transduction histidine kinase